MKKKIGILLLFVMVLFVVLPVPASADIGPKPSTEITFSGLEGETYYVTLLSPSPSNGPSSAYDGITENARYHEGEEEYGIWKKFVDYADTDGFYFLQVFGTCRGNDSFRWGYYPPSTFKILLYFPKYDTFAVSGQYERYAFDSYYTVDMAGYDIRSVTQGSVLSAKKSYDYKWETVSLLCRIVLTILLEVGVALLFGYRERKQLLFILLVNVITQTALNVLLNVINYFQGALAFTLYYLTLECLVFASEAILYYFLMKKFSRKECSRNWLAVVYAFAANTASFAAGLVLAHWIPGIF